MSDRAGNVFFREHKAGRIFEREDHYVFEYDPAYLKSAHPAISFTLPKRAEPFESRMLFPFFDGLIPEGWILQLTVKTWKIDLRDRMGLLLSVCQDTIGAITVRDQKDITLNEKPSIQEEPIAPIPQEDRCLSCYRPLLENELAYHASCARKLFGQTTVPSLNLTKSNIEDLAKAFISTQRTLTGVQKKLSLGILTEDGGQSSRLTLRDYVPDFILKPSSEEFPYLPENEALLMAMARELDIMTAASGLIRLASGEMAYVTRRFDRHRGRKLALEDMAQITETMTENKYRSSIEKVGRSILLHATSKGNDAFRLMELVVFCYLTGNADMHLKNFSLLTDEKNISLSPAYDLVSTHLVISMQEDPEESALAINGKKNKLARKDFVALAEQLDLNEKILNNIIKKFSAKLKDLRFLIERSFLPQDQQNLLKSIIKSRLAIF